MRLLSDEPVQLLIAEVGRIDRAGSISAVSKRSAGSTPRSSNASAIRYPAELDSAIKRIGECDHAGGTAGGQDGDLRPVGAALVASDECRHRSTVHGSGLRPVELGLRTPGAWPASSFMRS